MHIGYNFLLNQSYLNIGLKLDFWVKIESET